ncbi:Hypothetical protein LUCI_4439, partial [Lucifera butyrica]
TKPSLPLLPPKAKISVLVSPHIGIAVEWKLQLYPVLPYIKPVKKEPVAPSSKQKSTWRPPDSHYYKYGHTLINKVSFEDTDKDILAMLESIFLCKYA